MSYPQVIQLVNMEGLNTLFRVLYDDGEEEMDRIIYKYIEGTMWVDQGEAVP